MLLYGPPEDLEDFSDSEPDSHAPEQSLVKNDASSIDNNSLGVSNTTMTDIDYVCADISHGITTLYGVSVLMQRAEAPERIEKYAKFPVSHYVDYETGRIKDKFPHLTDPASNLEFLVNRLAQANLRRRQMFNYALSHHKKIGAPAITVRQHSEVFVTDAKTVQDQTETFPKAGFLQPAMSVSHAPSETTATLCIEPNTIQHLRYELQAPSMLQVPLSQYSPSEVSSIASSYASGEVKPSYCIPPRPKGSNPLSGEKAYSECPYCFKMIFVSNDGKWKYVCCLEPALFSPYIMLILLGNTLFVICNLSYARSRDASSPTGFFAVKQNGISTSSNFTQSSGSVM